MLPKEHRLKRDQDLKSVFTRGGGGSGRFFYLKRYPNQLGVSRFAFVVGSKVSKSAVLRNKIRRRMREVVRLRLPSVRMGMDIAVVAKPEVRTVSSLDARQDLERLLKRANIL